MRCALVLETGKIFFGECFGAEIEAWGEVVFNTGMTGYQEVLTDPSYADQIVCMTYPLVGNYGVNLTDNQSKKIQVRGFIVKEAAEGPNHWQMEWLLSEKLLKAGVPGIKGIDTRALTRHIREYGVLKGVITSDLSKLEDTVVKIKQWQNPEKPVPAVSTPEIYSLPAIVPNPNGKKYHVVAIDFGIKGNILHAMQQKGFDITVVPYNTPVEDILALKPDGIFLSNGPGDPKDVSEGIQTIQGLVKEERPIFGICLGHQLLALALGGDTYKLKFGHRGGNQPVQDLRTSKVTITSQNHGYAVAENSLKNLPLKVTHLNLNDKTVEGIIHTELPAFSVQYHPEAGPGPSDSLYLFDEFAALIDVWRDRDAT
ncbi:MAG: glutamine-hydrolyzing carbamoyl-phosphate synthase small subunit [Peptococcaceae bacterium]|nr:glutamine-hydrolyzing carbamoyl-phosphate synthase small subunit [Peptococcaceae bacterium]